MWAEAEYRQGRMPSGADLDRIAGTHNYGRRVLRKWRTAGQFRRARWLVHRGSLGGCEQDRKRSLGAGLATLRSPSMRTAQVTSPGERRRRGGTANTDVHLD